MGSPEVGIKPCTDGAAPVEPGVACPRCAYDLGGLPPDGLCPECAGPIADALAGDHLAYADPEWRAAAVRGLHVCARGLRIAGFLLVALLLLWLALMVLVFAGLSNSFAGGFFDRVAMVVGVPMGAIALYAGALMLVGSWWLTRPDPRADAEGRWAPATLGGRFALVVAAGAFVARPLVASSAPPSAIAPATNILGWVAWFCVLAALAGWLTAASELARRTDADRVARAARRLARRMVKWMGIASGAGIGVSAVIIASRGGPLGSELSDWHRLLASVTGLVAFFAALSAGGHIVAIDRHVRRALGQPDAGRSGTTVR